MMFFALVLLLVYAWAAYPVMAGWVARRRGDRDSGQGEPDTWPRVAVVFSAHNEAGLIRARLENLLSVDYPRDLLTVHAGIDGSSDRTAAVAEELAAGEDNVRVHVFEANRGKVAVLKDLVQRAGASARPPDILIFTDANTLFAPDALRLMARHFASDDVGGVCGRLVFVDNGGTETHESAYWRWETWLKEQESRVDSCLGANGAIYAVRPEAFWEGVPDNTIVDDFVLGMKVREGGRRMLFEPRAVAREDLPASVSDEWIRRVRIGAGDYQALKLCAGCLSPRYGAFAWMFWSHKVLRWFTPHLLLCLVISAWCLVLGSWCGGGAAGAGGWARVPALVVSTGSLLAAVSAGLGRLWRGRRGWWAAPFRVAGYFLTMQAALLVGFLRFCRGDLKGHWSRTPRASGNERGKAESGKLIAGP